MQGKTNHPLKLYSGRVQRLIGQLRWVTRISTALTHNVQAGDLYSIILSALIAPDGLGYSHALLFEADRNSGQLRGKMAMGPKTRREALALRRELKAEDEYLRSIASDSATPPAAPSPADAPAASGNSSLPLASGGALPDIPSPPSSPDLSSPPPSAGAPASLFTDDSQRAMRMLEDSKHWIALIQDTEIDRGACSLIQQVACPIEPGAGAPPSFLQWAAARTFPTALSAPPATCLPPEEPLLSCLAFPLVAVPLRTPKGLCGLLVIDRRFSRKAAFVEEDLQELDWFALQAALAIENAELIGDLEDAYQQLKELDTLKSNFLSIISHELRTPMTAILGFVDLLLDERAGEIGSSQRSLLVRVSKNANHLLQILNDLLEVSEVQAEGMRDLLLRPVDPLSVFFNTLPRLEQRRRDHNVEIDPRVHESIPRILCEARSLERIYFHLLDNAIKFSTPGGKVQVEYTVVNSNLEISVRDEGIGIAPDRLQRIFDCFYQVDGRLSRSYEGLGLGLTVTRLLLQATHGTIRVQSTLGSGSTFTISYPLAPS